MNNPSGSANAVFTAAFQTYLNSTSDMVFVKDADLNYVAVSIPFLSITNKDSADEVIGQTDFDIFDDELARRYTSDDRRVLESGRDQIDYVEPLSEDADHPMYGSTSKYILTGRDGRAIGLLGITRDVTLEYITRQRHQRELEYLFKLPEDTYAAIYVDIESWRIISQRRQTVNGCMLLSCEVPDDIRSNALKSLEDNVCEAFRFYQNFSGQFLYDLYASGRSSLTMESLRHMPNGVPRWVYNDVKFLTEPDNGHLCVMITVRDIDEEKRQELELVTSARLDRMTMLLNRECTMESIRQTLSEEPDSIHALFMLDVDNFKALNDTLGHQAGDEFLIALSSRLRGCFRECDIVGRMGGDEFFMLMKNITDISAAQAKAAALLCSIHSVCANYPSVSLSCSIGGCLYPRDGMALEELYAQADSALYQAKKQGKDQFFFAAAQ